MHHLDREFLSSKVEIRFSDGFTVLEISQKSFRDENKKICIGISASCYPASSR